MELNREQFWEDVDSGEVHIRDKWQFALKSDFCPNGSNKTGQYTQDFYFFIPSSLQVNSFTYTRYQFILDQTTLIRYKTPEMLLGDLLNLEAPHSPLTRITVLCKEADTPVYRKELSDELKLLANVFRSALRKEAKRINRLIHSCIKDQSYEESVIDSISLLCDQIGLMRGLLKNAQESFLAHWKDPLFYRQFLYVDEFMTDVIIHFSAQLLYNLRKNNCQNFAKIDDKLADILIQEQKHLDFFINNQSFIDRKHGHFDDEYWLYRSNLLDKFVLDALQLSTKRYSVDEQYHHHIGVISGGIAITIYLILFAWLGQIFVINSAPFILLAAVFYIIKDRLKDWLKAVSVQKASELFPEYTTVIRTPDDKHDIGRLSEDFIFLTADQLPQEVRVLRNAGFHSVLETYQRPENVIFYRRVLQINEPPKEADKRRSNLNVIFRLNISDFLRLASEPTENHLTINPETKELVTVTLHKVYHINMIIKSTSSSEDGSTKVDLKKIRLIVDKKGIRRIEQV